MDSILPYLARILHIASAITLMGGLIFAATSWLPGMQSVADSQRQLLSDAIAVKFRPWLAAAIVGLLVSGFYNYMRASARGVPSLYHMVFGMKFLLALHVFAVGWLALNRGNTKRHRQIIGVVISGLIIIALSAWMRYLGLSIIVPKS